MTCYELARKLLELPDLQVVLTPVCGETCTQILQVREIPTELAVAYSEHMQRCKECKPNTSTVVQIWYD